MTDERKPTHGVVAEYFSATSVLIDGSIRAPTSVLIPLPPAITPEAARVIEAVAKWIEETMPIVAPGARMGSRALAPIEVDLVHAYEVWHGSLAPKAAPDPVEILADAMGRIRRRAERDHTGCNPQVLGDDVTEIVRQALALSEKAIWDDANRPTQPSPSATAPKAGADPVEEYWLPGAPEEIRRRVRDVIMAPAARPSAEAIAEVIAAAEVRSSAYAAHIAVCSDESADVLRRANARWSVAKAGVGGRG